jgi:MFS family permease
VGVKRTHHRLTLAVLTLAAMAYALLQSLVLPALPTMQRELHVSQTAITWMLTSYLLSASVATPTVGRLGDMYGKQRVLGIVMLVLAAGTLISALASSFGFVLFGRFLQGIGGGIFPLGFGIIRDEFPATEVPGGIGLMSSVIGIGGGAGVVLSGVIVKNASYHWLFWLPLAVIVVSAAAVYAVIPEAPVRVPGRVNWVAAALLSVGLTVVLVAVSEAISWGWGSARTIALLLAGLALLAAWIRTEVRAAEPLVDMRTMRIRGVWSTNLVAFLVGVGMYSSFILIPQYVQEPVGTGYGLGASVLAAGFFLAPLTLAMLVAGQFTGILDRLIGAKGTLMCGMTCSAAAFALLALTPHGRGTIYLASGFVGIGTGLVFAALPILIVQNVRHEDTGMATGVNAVTRTLGGALGGQLAATLLAASVGAAGLPSRSGYGLAFGLCAGALTCALAAGLLIPDPRGARVDLGSQGLALTGSGAPPESLPISRA